MRRVLECMFCLLVVVAPVFSQTASEYSEKDKKKMAEIAQRPEVQQRIDEEGASEAPVDADWLSDDREEGSDTA